MGLYSALIIKPKQNVLPIIYETFTILLQDWNHNDDSETSYLQMVDGVYNLNTRKFINASRSVDRTKFCEIVAETFIIHQEKDLMFWLMLLRNRVRILS